MLDYIAPKLCGWGVVGPHKYARAVTNSDHIFTFYMVITLDERKNLYMVVHASCPG